MALAGVSLPHSKTKLLCKFTPFDYGPLTQLPDAATVVGSFRGGSYYLTEVEAEDGILLYRLYDDKNARACGTYWTFEEREGVLGDRIDLAMPVKWNDLTKSNSLRVPKGMYLYEGPTGPQPGGLVGGGWQVFMPREVLKPLCMAMDFAQDDTDKTTSTIQRREAIEQCIQEAKQNQKTFFESYKSELNQINQKITDDFCKSINVQALLKTGNNLSKLDPHIRNVLASRSDTEATCNLDSVGISDAESYLLHSDEVRLADGSVKCISLYVQLDASHVTFKWK